MRYDVTEHPLLSGKAKAMAAGDEEAFKAQAEIAETYLGLLNMQVLTGDKAVLTKHFLALQINWQIEIGIDPFYLRSISSSHTQQIKTYKDVSIISPLVSEGFLALLRSWGYEDTVVSLRG